MVQIEGPSAEAAPEETLAVVSVETLSGTDVEFLVPAGESVEVRSDEPVSVQVQTPPADDGDDV